MKYEVIEKKYFKIDDLLNILKFDYELIHLETTFNLEKYQLKLNVEYIDIDSNDKIKELTLPIDFGTTMTETLIANVKRLDINKVKDGIEIELVLEIEIIDNNESKEEIMDNYQEELEEKLLDRESISDEVRNDIIDDEFIPKIESNEEIVDFSKLLKDSFCMYRVLSLDEESLDKISTKYNLPLDYLYKEKNNKNKVIVYVKE